MADVSHIEKMGRELKCPICLSLLDSAASLTCNHVFCTSCILNSLKSSSNCPVCKAPYRRREIRAAPHMDNLVKIYKTMEVASGLSLFVTQNPATNKLTGSEKLDEGILDPPEKETGLETPKAVRNNKMKRVLSKKFATETPKSSRRRRGRPSFQTNKRVQVPHSPITETPVRQAENDIGKTKMANEVINNSSISPKGHPPSNGKGSPGLSPFFWLREDEDADKSSQQIDVDLLTATPVKAPSFSDIKDSDDDSSSRMSPKEERLRKSNNVDLFDSGMFEWTQRECSPELCSSPTKVGAINEICTSPEKLEEPLKCEDTNKEEIMDHDVGSFEKNSVRNIEVHNGRSPGSRSDDQIGTLIPCKRGTDASNKKHSKRRKINVLQDRNSLGDGDTEDFIRKQESDSELVLGNYTKLQNEVNDIASELRASSDGKKVISEDKRFKKSKKNFKSMRQANQDGIVQGKKNKPNVVTPEITDGVIVSQERQPTESQSNISKTISDEKTCDHKLRFINSKLERKGRVYDEAAQAAENNDQLVPHSDVLEGSLTKSKIPRQRDKPILLKCDLNSIKCAFCHSSEETEASEEMIHYSGGRPVSKNHTAGSVIHSHRNCTEWAPNVYFEDDIAVNLEEELSRSRRIKCSLCGMKGAALGCYEKSCRKSFHVPCAKKLRECRWDDVNFVILCPLHASLKLPCELSIFPQKKRMSKQKVNHLSRQPQVAAGHSNRNLWNICGPSVKVALCCSGLSTFEKEIVSEFGKASGAVVLTSFAPTVTHVIASVDENGACKRTLKVLMGILEGKWILSIKWVQACMKALGLVDEAPYEISSDVHGVKNGPRLGRLRLLNKQPKLFAGYKFYLIGEFAPSYKGFLQDLVVAAGGAILNRKPIIESDGRSSQVPPTMIIYSAELTEKSDLRKKDLVLARRRSDAEAFANSTGSKVANNLWLLKCVAGYKLHDL